MAPGQSEETLNKLRWFLHHLTDWELAGVDGLTATAKSLVVALAVWRNRISIDDALKASRLEEDFQISEYGGGWRVSSLV